MKTICVIPAFNEEATIGNVLCEVIHFVDEVIVVDDGSDDQTAEISRKIGAHVISHSHNMGVGVAFSTGISEALKLGAGVAVTIDADGQFKAEDIPRLIQPILNDEADFVSGTRFSPSSSPIETTKVKKFGNKLFTGIVNKLAGQHFTDTQCGFRAYSREAMLRLTTFGKFTYTQEVFLNLVNKNLRIIELPVEVRPRKMGKSRVVKNPFNYGLRALKIILQFERDFHPLLFFGAISMFFLIPGLLMLSLVFINWIITGMSSPYTQLISIGGLLTLVAIIFLILALIADMNGRQRLLQEELLYLMRKQSYEQGRGGNNL